MQEKLENLKKLVGQPYNMFWPDHPGKYLGCFAPVYTLYGEDSEKYCLPDMDVKNPENYKYGIKQILKHFYRITPEERQPGDMVTGCLNNELHVAICLDGDKIIHVCREHSMKISRLPYLKDIFTDLIFFRKK